MLQKILHSPLKQFLIALVLVMGYWIIHIYSYQEVAQIEQYEKGVDTTSVYIPPPPNEIEIITTLDWWDMILGHVGSILGSLAALIAPIFTYLNERKRKLKKNKNE